MTTTSILSVNPSGKSLGAKFLEISRNNMRMPLPDYVESERNRRAAHNRRVNFLFPTRRANLNGSLVLLSLRLMMAGMMLWSVLTVTMPVYMIIGLCCFIALLAAGVFTRFTAPAAALFGAACMFAGGVPLASAEVAVVFVFMALCLTLAGPGRVSADSLLRKRLLKPQRQDIASFFSMM